MTPKYRYVVWATQGQGSIPIKEFTTLRAAKRYVDKHEGEASFGIKLPTGDWYKW